MTFVKKIQEKIHLELAVFNNINRKTTKFNNDSSVILFYIPEAFFEIHFISMCLLAKSLQEIGYNVLIPTCHSEFELCPPYLWLNDDASIAQKKQRCNGCSKLCNDGVQKYGLPTVNLSKLLNKEVHRQVELSIKNAPENLLNFEYDGIEFGKLTSYQFVLLTKVSKFHPISNNQREKWLKLIQTSIISYEHVKEIKSRYNISNVVYYNFYSTDIGAAIAAKKLNIPSIYNANISHRGFDRSWLFLCPPTGPFSFPENWNKWRGLKINQKQLTEAYLDLYNNVFSIGSHRYSPEKVVSQKFNILDELGIDKSKKILVAYTASDDELLGFNNMLTTLGYNQIQNQNDCFENQIEWIDELIKFVEASSEYYLIIRIHPRSGKNKFNDTISELYMEFLDKFSFEMKNCTIIHPESKVASHDLAEVADVCLLSWSSIGEDFSRMGIPCVASVMMSPTYPDDSFVYVEKNKDDYFNRIKILSKQTFSLENTLLAYRWYVYSRFSNSLNFEGLSNTFVFEGFPNLPDNKNLYKKIEKVIVKGEDISELNLQERIAIQSEITEADEKYFLIKLLAHIIHVNITGENLILEKNAYIVSEIDIQKFIILDDGYIKYTYLDKEYYRYSKSLIRILNFLQTIN